MKISTRIVTLAAATVGALAVVAAPAFAHVSVNPGEAEKGGFAILSFSVPNERDDASTTKVEVQMPQNKVIAFVRVQPKPGWTVTVTKRTLDKPVKGGSSTITEVVDTVTWEGGEIGPGEFDLFTVSAGPLPKKGKSLSFKALQTYSSGEVVRWIETGDDAELPAAVLTLVDAEDGDDHGH